MEKNNSSLGQAVSSAGKAMGVGTLQLVEGTGNVIKASGKVIGDLATHGAEIADAAGDAATVSMKTVASAAKGVYAVSVRATNAAERMTKAEKIKNEMKLKAMKDKKYQKSFNEAEIASAKAKHKLKQIKAELSEQKEELAAASKEAKLANDAEIKRLKEESTHAQNRAETMRQSKKIDAALSVRDTISKIQNAITKSAGTCNESIEICRNDPNCRSKLNDAAANDKIVKKYMNQGLDGIVKLCTYYTSCEKSGSGKSYGIFGKERGHCDAVKNTVCDANKSGVSLSTKHGDGNNPIGLLNPCSLYGGSKKSRKKPRKKRTCKKRRSKKKSIRKNNKDKRNKTKRKRYKRKKKKKKKKKKTKKK